MSPKEKRAIRLNDRLIARLITILGKHGFLNLGLHRARLVRKGEALLIVAHNVHCKGCGLNHRTLIHLAAPRKQSLRKLFKK